MLRYVSIVLEAVIVILSLRMVFVRKRFVGVGFAVTFTIYVFYDLAHAMKWQVSDDFLQNIFFIATLSALITIAVIGERRAPK